MSPFDPLALVQSAPCAVFALDAKTRIVFANRTALTLLGTLPSELLGAAFVDCVAEGHRDLVTEALGREPFAVEVSLLLKGGDTVAASLHGQPTDDGWCVTAEDRAIELELRTQLATAREATEFQLARAIEMSERNKELLAVLDGEATLSTRTFKTEEGLERALRSAGLASWHWDVAMGGATLRGAYDTFFGFRPEDMNGIREGIAPEDRDVLWKAAERTRREKVPLDVRVHIQSRDGTTRLVRVAGTPRLSLRGEVAGVDGILVDETERERQKDSLAHLDRELRLLVEGMSDGVLLVDRDWTIQYVNRRGAELVGKTPAEMIGRHGADIFPRGQAPAFVRAHRKAMVERIPTEIEDHFEPLGKTFVHRVYPTDDGIAVFFQDVTDRRRREERLRVSEQRMRELGGRMRDAREEEAKRIAREIHDDLGQALTVLKMDVARARGAASKGADPLVALAEMDKVIDDAIATTRRIAADLRPAILDDLGLAAAIAWHASQVRTRASFEIAVRVPSNDVSIGSAEATVLYRVLQEALTNIARHAQAKVVHIELREKTRDVTLEVTDDGRGFDPEAPTRSFGLLGMRERIASVGGRLTVTSGAGKGTTIRAQVPRKVAFDTTPTLPDSPPSIE